MKYLNLPMLAGEARSVRTPTEEATARLLGVHAGARKDLGASTSEEGEARSLMLQLAGTFGPDHPQTNAAFERWCELRLGRRTQLARMEALNDELERAMRRWAMEVATSERTTWCASPPDETAR